MSVPDTAIGSRTWPGLAKLLEECGELQQVIGKLIAYPGGEHPDGAGPLPQRLLDEMADVAAAISYVVHVNDLSMADLRARQDKKVARFDGWHRAAR